MRRLIAVLMVVACLLPVQVSAQDTYPVTVTVYTPVADDAEVGDECQIAANIESATLPWPQLIATMANGVIVGYVDLIDGTVATIEDTTLTACAVSADMDLTPSPFYTFTIDGEYRRTVSDNVLEDLDHQLYVAVF